MRTARLLAVGGSLGACAHPRTQGRTPPDPEVHPPDSDADTTPGPRGRPPPPTPWTEWLSDRCKNIILPQTSFAGGNNNISVLRINIFKCFFYCASVTTRRKGLLFADVKYIV